MFLDIRENVRPPVFPVMCYVGTQASCVCKCDVYVMSVLLSWEGTCFFVIRHWLGFSGLGCSQFCSHRYCNAQPKKVMLSLTWMKSLGHLDLLLCIWQNGCRVRVRVCLSDLFEDQKANSATWSNLIAYKAKYKEWVLPFPQRRRLLMWRDKGSIAPELP